MNSSANWAIVVDATPNKSVIPAWRAPEHRKDSVESAYARGIRTRVSQAVTRVAAIICFQTQYAHFDGGEPVPYCRIALVGCLPAYRGTKGLMNGLFAMVNARSIANGDKWCQVFGIPSWYRQHGYEVAMRQLFEMKTPMHSASPPPTEDSPNYNLRAASPSDLDSLYRLQEVHRLSSNFAFSRGQTKEQLSFLLGAREPPFDDSEDLDRLEKYPVSILEYKGRAVAAVVWFPPFGPADNPVTWRTYVDPAHHDLGQLSCELVSRTIAAVNALFDDKDASKGYVESENYVRQKPKEINWRFGPGNPLVRHFLDSKLAYDVSEESMLYSSFRYQSFRLHSLAIALGAMQTALTARLKAAKLRLGSAITFDLGIAFYQTSIEGAVIHIERGVVAKVEGKSFKHLNLSQAGHVGRDKSVQLVGNPPAITQIIFGYLTLAEAKKVYADLQVAVGCGMLLEVLFPQLQCSGHLYM